MAEQAIINTSTLTSIGDAIREKTGKSDTFLPSDMPAEILAIETGSDVSGVTAAASDVRSGKKFVDSSGAVVTGTVTARTASNVTSSNNVVVIPAGIYDSKVSKTVGTAKSAATYTPGTSNQTIPAGYYLTGTQTIKGDANLVASNIKSGTSIFGITGNYQGDILSYEFSETDVYRGTTTQLIIKLPSGYKNKTISGFVEFYETNNSCHIVVMFYNFNFNSYTNSSGQLLIHLNGHTYIDFDVYEAEGTTGIMIDVSSNFQILNVQYANGIIYYS